MIRNKRFFKNEDGATAVEFSIIGPLLIFLLIAIFFGAIWANAAYRLQNAAEKAARYAAVQGTSALPCSTAALVKSYIDSSTLAAKLGYTNLQVYRQPVTGATPTSCGCVVSFQYAVPQLLPALPPITAKGSACYPANFP
jgi:Flp pilus assembly protein TadG